MEVKHLHKIPDVNISEYRIVSYKLSVDVTWMMEGSAVSAIWKV